MFLDGIDQWLIVEILHVAARPGLLGDDLLILCSVWPFQVLDPNHLLPLFELLALE